MTRARAFITKQTRWAASIGAIGGFCATLITLTIAGSGLYYGLEARIAHAQTTGENAQATASAAQTAAQGVIDNTARKADLEALKAETEKKLDEIKSDVREIRNDVKTLLQRK